MENNQSSKKCNYDTRNTKSLHAKNELTIEEKDESQTNNINLKDYIAKSDNIKSSHNLFENGGAAEVNIGKEINSATINGNSEESHTEKISQVTWSPHSDLDDRPADIKLCVENFRFKVHKDVLEKSCDYFKAMFHSSMIEQSKEEIILHSVKPEPFNILVQAFYSGHLECDSDSMYLVAETMQMLQVNESLFNQCISYFKNNTNLSNCFEIWFFAEEFNIQTIYSNAKRFCLAYFIELWKHQSFLSLTPSQLLNYLSDDYLCVDHEAEVLQSIRHWLCANHQHQESIPELLPACVRLKDTQKALAIAKKTVMSSESSMPTDTISDIFDQRRHRENILMFWSLLESTKASGLVDVVRLCPDMERGVLHDSMKPVLEQPGLDVGSAICVRGPYVYLSGGGPGFGKVNWIRKLCRYDVTKVKDRWTSVGELTETRRHHAMVALGDKLYLFGGFGKFRVRNSELDCFDLNTATWRRLPPMPSHTIKPVSTSNHNAFYYIDAVWNIYSFNIDSETWTTINRSAPLTSMPVNPVAMHILCGDQSDSFIMVSQDEQARLSICRMAWTSEPGTMIPVHQDLLDCEEILRHSVVESNRLLLFLEEKYDPADHQENNEEEETIIVIKSYDTKEKKLSDWMTVTNIKKAQNVVVVPDLPQLHRIGNH